MENRQLAQEVILETLGYRVAEIDESLMPLIIDAMTNFAMKQVVSVMQNGIDIVKV